ncbi:MAG TPA: efflux RND transporter periplasmic adaptor subunit [Anaeromyxobacteraceae bacterium]|nr:efflux RND transporter periplasmic adaptor subunit [Anaeromyxobacteraceae bacterium]
MSDRVPDDLPEGRETPPPGVRTMAAVRWGLVALMALAAGGAWVYWSGLRERPAQAAAVAWQCPMHPAVLQDRPGDCPICGMSLVQVQPGARRKAAAAPAAATGPGKYWCPMHPEVHSDDPEARCEKCGGMKLVPRDAAAPAGGEARSVPGLVPVDIGAERIQLMGIRTARVVRESLSPQLRTVGFVSANESTLAIITARFTGWVEELKVAQSGQKVARGQVLASVYSPELTTAQQVYVNAMRWTRDPGAGAAPGGAVGGNLDQDARRRLELLGVAPQDVAEIARTGKPLPSTPIRSPVSGYVARRGALPGLYFTPGTELFQIADLSSVWVIADVYEYDMSRVKVGQRATLSLGAYPGERFAGRVQFIYPAVNPESRTLQARMEFRNPGLKLRPGMYGDVVVELDAADALAVPTEAIVDTGETQYVFVTRAGGRFEPRRVRIGARAEGKVQVLEGLAAGETVVTTANFLVDSESRLRAAVEAFTPHDEAAEDEAAEHGPGRGDPAPSGREQAR